jgi:hypothetical protein
MMKGESAGATIVVVARANIDWLRVIVAEVASLFLRKSLSRDD